MIETGYFGNIKNYPETDWLVCVSRKYPWFIKRDKMDHLPQLAPSQKLLNDWKNDKISWEEYEKRYRQEQSTPAFMRAIYWIGLKHAQGDIVRLMCWEKNPPCHRFLLKDMIVVNELPMDET